MINANNNQQYTNKIVKKEYFQIDLKNVAITNTLR